MIKAAAPLSVTRFTLPKVPAAVRSVVWEAAYSSRGLKHLSIIFDQTAAASPTVSIDAPLPKLKSLKHTLTDRLNGGRAQLEWDDFDLQDTGDFHQRVWRAMSKIPFGETASYADIARDAGSPRGFRACGQACGANRIVIFIPCHRVIATSGKLNGFAYGLEMKKQFLAMERSKT